MGNFNIISFTELMQYGSSNVVTAQQNSGITQESQVPSNGVYIQDVSHKLWKIEDWDDSVKPNAIAVISGSIKFLVALAQRSSTMQISSRYYEPIENHMAETSSLIAAKTDYDGVGNATKILQVQPSATYAAGYCDSFVFPDGSTKGYLPSLGQLRLAFQNKTNIDAALSKCGGTAMNTSGYYWSSTFWGVEGRYRGCWELDWSDGDVRDSGLGNGYYVRPFANFNLFQIL